MAAAVEIGTPDSVDEARAEGPNPSFHFLDPNKEDIRLQQDPSIEYQYCPVDALGELGRQRVQAYESLLQYDPNDRNLILCYTTLEGELVPELRVPDQSVERQQAGINMRLGGVMQYKGHPEHFKTPQFRDDPISGPAVLRKFKGGVDGRMPQQGAVHSGLSYIPTFHDPDNASDVVGQYPFDGQALPGYVRITPVIDGATLTPVRPTDPRAIEEAKLDFMGRPTNAMTVGIYDPEKKRWVVQTLPWGEMSKHPWKGHYPINGITGTRFTNVGGEAKAFRLGEHKKRLIRDGAYIGCHFDRAALDRIYKDNITANFQYLTDPNNPFGNGCYSRMNFHHDAVGPGLYGDARRFDLLLTSLGPYRDTDLLDIVALGNRPVVNGPGGHKLGLNYYFACEQFKPFKRTPGNPDGFDECWFFDGERAQEGTSVNFGTVHYGAGKNGKHLYKSPPTSHGDVLPGIMGLSAQERLDMDSRFDVRGDEDVTEKDVQTANEIIVSGTAMLYRGVNQIEKPDGTVLFQNPNTGMGWVTQFVRDEVSAILRGRHADPKLQAWLEGL